MKKDLWASRLNELIQEPVISVIVIEDLAHAVPLARSLVAGGIHCLEVTLRTDVALDAIHQISEEVEGAVVGAGTLLTASHAKKATDAGAKFGVSPGTSHTVIDACVEYNLPLLPGVSTATEAMGLINQNITFAKFFPAEAAGGANFVKSLASPLPDISFCPTGGINLDNASDYLNLPNVSCVGGSWLTPASLVQAEAWDEITELAATSISKIAG